MVPGKHASTFGGNALACAAGIAVVEAIEEDNLLENAVQMGKYAQEKLRATEAKALYHRPCSRNRPDDWRSVDRAGSRYS